jgi:hypothetical protein
MFDSADVVEAMRLMQQTGHVGKILIRPHGSDRRLNSRSVSEFKVNATRGRSRQGHSWTTLIILMSRQPIILSSGCGPGS